MAETSKKRQPDRAPSTAGKAEPAGHRHEHPERVFEEGQDEQNDPRGAFIRVQIALAQLAEEETAAGDADGLARVDREAREKLRAAEQELLAAHREEWTAPFRRLAHGEEFPMVVGLRTDAQWKPGSASAQIAEQKQIVAEMQDGRGTRYRLLETIRQYAIEKLVECGRAETTRQRHFEYFEQMATAGVTEAEKRQMMCENAIAFFHLDRP